MKTVRFEIDGKSVEGRAEKIGGTLWLHLNGRTFAYVPAKPASRGVGARGGGRPVHGDLTAPMPGKINKVAVADGDPVTAGQVVLVMEAMKMEYTLKAQVAGRVTSVPCRVGDQVALGQTLVKIEPV